MLPMLFTQRVTMGRRGGVQIECGSGSWHREVDTIEEKRVRALVQEFNSGSPSPSPSPSTTTIPASTSRVELAVVNGAGAYVVAGR
jgi:hypothetical protein